MTFLAPRFPQARREAILLDTRNHARATAEATKAIAAEERARTQMLYDALTPEEKARVNAARAQRWEEHRRRCNRKMILTFIAVVACVITVATCAHAQSRETPIYDKDGRYVGSVHDYGRTQTYTDRDGRFNGSSINNGNGTTSFCPTP